MKSIFRVCFVYLVIFLIASVPSQAVQVNDHVPPEPPSGLCASWTTTTSISLSWEKSKDDTGVKGYQVFRDGRKIVTVVKTSYTNTSLIPGHAYTYCVKAYDAAGNVSDGCIPIKVSTVSDLQPPTAPSGLSVSTSSYTTVGLYWEPSTDNTGIKTYEIFRDGTKAAATVNTSYICKGLKPGTKYVFHVRAVDTAGNFSSPGNCVTAATAADRAAPSIPDGMRVDKVTETEVSLSWDPSFDNVKVKGYEILCEGQKTMKSGDTTYTYKGLVPGKSYVFRVAAYDGSGNISAAGKPLTAATVADTKAPSAPAGLKARKSSGTGVSLSWDASVDNVKVQGYHIYRNGIRIASTSRKTYTAKNPKGSGIWVFTVRAYDLSGNLSPFSKAATVAVLT